MGVQPRHFLAQRCGHYLVTGRAFLSGNEILLRRTAERAAVGMKTDHVEAADQTDVLFSFHAGLLQLPENPTIAC
jgi:hypothetical protein